MSDVGDELAGRPSRVESSQKVDTYDLKNLMMSMISMRHIGHRGYLLSFLVGSLLVADDADILVACFLSLEALEEE